MDDGVSWSMRCTGRYRRSVVDAATTMVAVETRIAPPRADPAPGSCPRSNVIGLRGDHSLFAAELTFRHLREQSPYAGERLVDPHREQHRP